MNCNIERQFQVQVQAPGSQESGDRRKMCGMMLMMIEMVIESCAVEGEATLQWRVSFQTKTRLIFGSCEGVVLAARM